MHDRLFRIFNQKNNTSSFMTVYDSLNLLKIKVNFAFNLQLVDYLNK